MSPAEGEMRQEEVHIWLQLPQDYPEVDCPGHPGSCQTRGHCPSIQEGQKEVSWGGGQVKERGGFFPCSPNRMPRATSPYSALAPSHSTPLLALFLPPEKSSLTPFQNHSTCKSRFKFLHLQEASSDWNIARINMKPCTWVPELRECGITCFVKESQSIFLESEFCVRQQCDRYTKN